MLYPKKYFDWEMRSKNAWEVRSSRPYLRTHREVLAEWFSSNNHSRKYQAEISNGLLTKSVYSAVGYVNRHCHIIPSFCLNVSSVRKELEVMVREYQCAKDWQRRYYASKKKMPARSDLLSISPEFFLLDNDWASSSCFAFKRPGTNNKESLQESTNITNTNVPILSNNSSENEANRKKALERLRDIMNICRRSKPSLSMENSENKSASLAKARSVSAAYNKIELERIKRNGLLRASLGNEKEKSAAKPETTKSSNNDEENRKVTSNENDKSNNTNPESGMSESDSNRHSETSSSEISDDVVSGSELGSVRENSVEESNENGDTSTENNTTINSNNGLDERNKERPLREDNEATGSRSKKRKHAKESICDTCQKVKRRSKDERVKRKKTRLDKLTKDIKELWYEGTLNDQEYKRERMYVLSLRRRSTSSKR